MSPLPTALTGSGSCVHSAEAHFLRDWVRHEDEEEAGASGCEGRGNSHAAVATQLWGIGVVSIQHPHVVVSTALGALNVHVGEGERDAIS